MKPLLISLLLMVTLLGAQAQSDSSAAPAKPAHKNYLQNNFKINLSSLALNNYSLFYEHSLTRKLSFQLGYAFMPNTILGNNALIKKIVDRIGDDSLKSDVSKISVSYSAITGELRYYFGKKGGARGFYASLYGRYMNLKMNYDYHYKSSSNQQYDIPISGHLKGIGAGLLIGHQWLIAKKLVLDLYIIGGHYGNLSGNIDGLADLSSLSASDKQDLQDQINSKVKIGSKQIVTATVSNDGVRTVIDGPFVGIRAAGLSLGFAF